jgi:glycosyltransferase involved in cell wall biosynthesis
MAYGIEAWRHNNALRQKSLRKADLILAISRYTRDWLIEREGVNPQRVQLLAPTYTAEQFSICSKPQRLMQKYGLTAQTPVILTVCRLAEEERYKGYDQIIKAMPQILRQVPNARYVLAGKGPDRPRIEKLIAEVGVQDAVTLAGFVPDEELADHYNLCDLFAMPSKAEGFGIVYLEALACGKPALAGNKDGSRDALADGELGLLVDPDSTTDIAEAIISVLRREHPHPNLFRPEFLRHRVIELFGFEAFKRKIADQITQFINLESRDVEPDAKVFSIGN